MRFAVLLMIMTLVIIAACGSPQNPEDIATKAGQEWVESNTDRAAEEVVRLIIGNQFIVTELAAEALEQKVSNSMAWTYSSPRHIESDMYELVATASVDAVVPIPIVGDKTYAASLPFNLAIDTGNGSVTNWKPLPLDASVDEK